MGCYSNQLTPKAPERIETLRLVLRKPRRKDAKAVFERYAGDANVTKFLGWPRHRSVRETRHFVDFSESEWDRWPAGPYLVECRETKLLLGGTGLAFETPYRAATGYVLARDAWGKGYATEALLAMVHMAETLAIRRLYALCHSEHVASSHVLEKCGFTCEGILRRHSEFPNLLPGEPCDVRCYARVFG